MDDSVHMVTDANGDCFFCAQRCWLIELGGLRG